MKTRTKPLLALTAFLLSFSSGTSAREAKTLTTPDGHQLAYVLMPEKAETAISIVWRYGYGFLPRGKEFIKELGPALMKAAGTRSFGPAELESSMNDLGGFMRIKSHSDAITGMISIPTDKLPEIASLFNSMVREPRLDPRWLNRIQRRFSVAIVRMHNHPDLQAQFTYRHVTMGDHPWYRGDTATPRNIVATITAEDIRKWHQQTFSATDMHIAAAGSARPEVVSRAVDTILRGLPKTHARKNLPPLALRHPPKTILVHRPGGEKSTILIAGALNKDHESAMEAVHLATTVLGQSDQSRLLSALRYDLRAVYHFGADLEVHTDKDNELTMQGEVETAKLQLALDTLALTYETFRTGGITAGEFATARHLQANRLANRMLNPPGLAKMLSYAAEDGRSNAYALATGNRLAKLTREQVNQAIKRYFPPFDQLTRIVVSPDRNAVQADCIISDFTEALKCR